MGMGHASSAVGIFNLYTSPVGLIPKSVWNWAQNSTKSKVIFFLMLSPKRVGINTRVLFLHFINTSKDSYFAS